MYEELGRFAIDLTPAVVRRPMSTPREAFVERGEVAVVGDQEDLITGVAARLSKGGKVCTESDD
ncbi:hypothetical protein [Halobellus limi]|uniref:DmpG-like communication domain-containing protein n=1 Tax=Halobellus limi TaxID=699433 RepID=A0A1H6BQV3_9EURY|nr:hypothetical protein [Halobellus limi]SEG63073.1 DmpG-like communication domain-containing protein [Halobellus limi]